MQKVKLKSTIPYWAVSIFWLAYALLMPMYKMLHFVWPALISAALFLLAKRIWPDKIKTLNLPYTPPKTGIAQADEMMREGAELLRQMKQANHAITNPVISQKITSMEIITQQVFDYVSQNPHKLDSVRMFMNYYLPTTLKLLNNYDKFNSQPVKSEQVVQTMEKIDEMLDRILVAFERQLENLYQPEMLDVTTEIKVMEGMLKREGLDMRTDTEKIELKL